MEGYKIHAAVFAALNVVIVALAAVILFVPTGGGAEPVSAAPIYVHDKLRGPIAGAAPGIAAETRLMGYGDEEVVRAFFLSEGAYIFGNASVKGLDFDEYGGFLCMLTGGRITGFTYLEGRITAVSLAEGGFAVGCAVGGGGALYHVSLDGIAERKAELSGAPAELLAADGVITAVIAGQNTMTVTEYLHIEGEAQKGRSTLISSGFSLTYLGCYYAGGEYVLAARAFSLPRYDSLVFYTFTPGGDGVAHYYGGSGENALTPFAVQPHDNGYLALCAAAGDAAIVSVGYSFMSFRRDRLGYAATGASLFYCRGAYYARFDGDGGSLVYELDRLLDRRTVALPEGFILDAALDTGQALLAGRTGGGMAIAVGSKIVELDIKDVVFHGGGAAAADGYYVALSATGGSAISAPTSGRDIYIVKLDLAAFCE